MNKASYYNCSQCVRVCTSCFVGLTSLFILCQPICDIKDQISDVYLKPNTHLPGLKTVIVLQCVCRVSEAVGVPLWYLMFEVWCFFELQTIFPCCVWHDCWRLMKCVCVCVCWRENQEEREREKARAFGGLIFAWRCVSKDPQHKRSAVWCLRTLTRERTAFYILLCDCVIAGGLDVWLLCDVSSHVSVLLFRSLQTFDIKDQISDFCMFIWNTNTHLLGLKTVCKE